MGLKKFLAWFTGEKPKVQTPTSQYQKMKESLNPSLNSQSNNFRNQGTSLHVQQPVTNTNQKLLHITEFNSRHATGKKQLGYWVVLFILINSIIGSSLFYLPGLGVKTSGAASIIAWVVLFVIATLIMLYMSELVTLHPTSGGTYEFCKRAYGRFGSFISGWLIWIAGNLGMALAIVAGAEYFIPETSSAAFVLRMIFVGVWIVILNFMAYRGIDAGATMLVIFGVIAVIVVLGMTIPSFIDLRTLFSGGFSIPFDSSFLQPFFRHESVTILSYLALSLLLISEAFMGFEVVSYMANEVKEPHKLHKVIIPGIILTGLIMTVYVFSSLGTVGYVDYVTNARPFAVQALNTMGINGETFIVFGMYLVIVGAAAGWPIVGSRLLNAMARDKLFIKQLAVLHPKYKSPYKAIIFQTIVVFFFSWLIFRGYQLGWADPYRSIYIIFVLLSIIVLSLILLAVPILRKKESNLARPFKAPFGTAGPIFFVLVFIGLVVNWVWLERNVATALLSIAGSLVFLCLPLYFLVEMFYNPKSITSVNEKLSFLVVLGEKLFFPITIRKKLLKSMEHLSGKIVLEYGCSVGSLTKRLAQKVGPSGRIYATDLSFNKVKVASKRTKHIPHVSVHHHPHLDDFRLQLPQQVDVVISVGMLSYMQDPDQILKSLGRHVKKGGEIAFVDYDKFFYFIPNVEWIENDQKLAKMFMNAGFNVKIERKNGILWQYIIIVGEKI